MTWSNCHRAHDLIPTTGSQLHSATVPVFLIRHAHAGSRARWDSDDTNRPLSKKGIGQTAALTSLLRGEPITRIISSPALRCVQTVADLATALDIPVEIDSKLFEGGDPDEVIRLLDRWASDNVIVSSHGDVIPQVIRRLTIKGMHTDDPKIAQKGSVWILDTVEGSPVRGTYVPPPTTVVGED